MRRSWYGRAGLALAVLCAAACGESRVSRSQAVAATGLAACRVMILVSFDREPTAAELAGLAATSATSLSATTRLLPTLYGFDLAADEVDCGAALERLRAQAHVRSVELDTRRRPNPAPND